MRFVIASLVTSITLSGSSFSEENSGFLQTDYEPLSKSLDEYYGIDYQNMNAGLNFDHVPLIEVDYETSDLPVIAPISDHKSAGLSRRGLLL